VFYLESLLIKGFRNYHYQQLQFNPRLNIICGGNAQGKTNLLESIYYLSVTRSFRTRRDQELVNWEEPLFYLKGIFYKYDLRNSIRISYRKNAQLKVKVNDKAVSRYAHLQQFPIVVFSPDDVLLIREGPSIRRRFLNLEASRLSPQYFEELRAYQRVLQQRNNLLKKLYGRGSRQINELLEPWDETLVSLGSNIIHTRVKIIKYLEKEGKVFFENMTSSRETISLEYAASVEYSEAFNETKEIFRRRLEKAREIEIRKGSTVVGPHLDDLKIMINGYDSRKYSSQGQKRTAALSLKMAEVSLFRKEHNDCPIILLDDVFSEFDEKRKMHLLDFLRDNSGQCFISTAIGIDNLLESISSDYKTISIHQGRASDEVSRPGN